jgi:uncharacterized protein (TIGR02996 family)
MENEAFLRAIRSDLADDGLRLVYADWLEEHGQPERAAFIRLHIEWCSRQPDTRSDEVLRLRLISAWEDSGLHETNLPGRLVHVYDRGFVAGVQTQVSGNARDEMESLFSGSPIQVAWFRSAGEDDADWLPESQFLSQLTGLCFSANFAVVGRLLASPHMSDLELLHIGELYPEDAAEAARLIASDQHMNHVLVLDLDSTHLEDEGLAILAGASNLRSVLKLTMRSNNRVSHHVGEAGIRALTASQSLARLTHLGFCDCSTFDGAALKLLLEWAGTSQLLELDLSFTSLEGEDVAGLARCGKLKNLRRLCLSAFELSDQAVQSLAAPDALPALRELWVEAKEEYGDGADQTPEALDWLASQLGPRLILPSSHSDSFHLSPVGEADRIWQRLRRADCREEFQDRTVRIL